MKIYAFVDIDHTLSDAAWRDRLLPQASGGTWDDYHEAAKDDKPILEMVRLVNSLYDAGTFIMTGLTSRPEKWRQLTQQWLMAQRVRIGELLMRPDADWSPSAECKVRMVEQFFGDDSERMRRETAFVVDDRVDIIEAFRARGITTLHIAAGRPA